MEKRKTITVEEIYKKNKFFRLLSEDFNRLWPLLRTKIDFKGLLRQDINNLEDFERLFTSQIDFKDLLRQDINNKEPSLSEKEQFLRDTFLYTLQILFKLKHLEYFIPFINSFPRTKLWQKTFNRVDYIEYHLSFYFVNVVSSFDYCLLLVNLLWNLGIPDKDVRYELITNNLHLQNTETKKIIDEFNKFLDKREIKKLRNMVVHRRGFQDPVLVRADLWLFLSYDDQMNGEGKEFFKSLAEEKIKNSISAYKKAARSVNNQVFEFVDKFLTSLVSQYEKIKNFLNFES